MARSEDHVGPVGSDGWEEVVARVGAAVGPALVRVGRDGRGAGLVAGEGVVVTNAHHVRGGQLTVTVGGEARVGDVTAVDADGDLAVVSVDTAGATPVELGGGGEVRPGRTVLAVAPGPRGLRVTVGMVSAVEQSFRGPRGRRIAGSIEHTAPLARGGSGSAVVATDGTVLGINTHRLDGGFYLALPAGPALAERVQALARGEAPTRRQLGVALAPARAARHLRAAVGLEPRDGVLVRAVVDGGPAAAAGVRQGDLITGIDGRPVTTFDDLHEALAGDGASVVLAVVRGVEELSVAVRFDLPSTGEGGAGAAEAPAG